MEKLNKEMWAYSKNAFDMLTKTEELLKTIEEYKELLNRKLLLNELDINNDSSGSEGFTSMEIKFNGVTTNFLGKTNIKLFQDKEVTQGLLSYLNETCDTRLNELREKIEHSVLNTLF